MKIIKLLFIVICFIGLAVTPISAFSIELLEDTCFLDKPGKAINGVISNKDDKMLAVELYAKTRTQSLDGTEFNEDAADTFLIVPSQILLQPGDQQVFSIIWQGEAKVDYELAYRLMVEEISIHKEELKLEPGQERAAKVYFLRKFARAIYVAPPEALPNIIIERATPTKNAQGKQVLDLVFANIGTKHQIIRNVELLLKPKDNLSALINPIH